MYDKFRKKHRVAAGTARTRQQIALEAARRLLEQFPGDEAAPPLDRLADAGESDYYSAKRKAAAVLGHRIRPGDLPSDDEVRDQAVVLWKTQTNRDDEDDQPEPDPDEAEPPATLAEALDRFEVYRLRLMPLEAVKQDPRLHPEGDALYHSLQVFHLAREARPYDEEFLLAALLHDVGKAIDPRDHAAAAVEALRGSVTERTLWLIEHHMDLVPSRPLNARQRRELDESEHLEDLKLLRELDDAGRVPGAAVEHLEEALAYIRGLEHEAYLDE